MTPATLDLSGGLDQAIYAACTNCGPIAINPHACIDNVVGGLSADRILKKTAQSQQLSIGIALRQADGNWWPVGNVDYHNALILENVPDPAVTFRDRRHAE